MDASDRPRTRPGALIAWLLFVIAASLALSLLLRLFGIGAPESPYDPDAAPRLVEARGNLAEDERATIALFERAAPSVVHINTTRRGHDRFTLRPLEIVAGTGTGFVWDAGGHVVTNYHVVADALRRGGSILVHLSDQSTHGARVIGAAPEFDLAVLRVSSLPRDLRPIPIGRSADLRVGQKVFAIGNPFGLDQTLTTGVVSGLGREIVALDGTPIRNVIQTDAAINPGNSGGPLLDSAGRLIGVNTQIYTTSGSSAGVGFAIPADIVNEVVPHLLRTGTRPRAGLGIELVSEAAMERLGVEGVGIQSVEPGSAADRAGLRGVAESRDGGVWVQDVIVGIGGEPVESWADLLGILKEREVGETITVRVLREEGREVDVPVTLQALD